MNSNFRILILNFINSLYMYWLKPLVGLLRVHLFKQLNLKHFQSINFSFLHFNLLLTRPTSHCPRLTPKPASLHHYSSFSYLILRYSIFNHFSWVDFFYWMATKVHYWKNRRSPKVCCLKHLKLPLSPVYVYLDNRFTERFLHFWCKFWV